MGSSTSDLSLSEILISGTLATSSCHRLTTGTLHDFRPLIITSIYKPTTIISFHGPVISIVSTVGLGMNSENIFQPVPTDDPPSIISSRSVHPVSRLEIQPQHSPIGTNKFYANFFLGNQSAGTWTHPYSVAWSNGGGASGSWGMSVQHIDDNQRVFGPDPNANPIEYFINPSSIQSFVLSAAELGASTNICVFCKRQPIAKPWNRSVCHVPTCAGYGIRDWCLQWRNAHFVDWHIPPFSDQGYYKPQRWCHKVHSPS